MRDTAVTEFEKEAEASNAIFNAIKEKLSGRKKNSKSGIGAKSDAILFGAYQGKRKETP